MDRHTLLYLKWVTSKDLVYVTWNSAQCYAAAWMGDGSLGENGCTCMAVSLHRSSEIITTLIIGYTPIQNKKVFFN